MPRKTQHSGQHMIDRAQELFEASTNARKPDYRFVALAIGAAPIAPPRWAIEACIAEKEREEKRSAALGNSTADRVLDEVIRIYDRYQQQRDATAPSSAKPLSLRKALILAHDTLGEARAGTADDSWFRAARRAWDKEQKEDRRESHLRLDGFHITGRIERVLLAVQGPEYGYPADPVKELWLRNSRDGDS